MSSNPETILRNVNPGDLVIFASSEPPGLVVRVVKRVTKKDVTSLHLDILWPGTFGIDETVVTSVEVGKDWVSFIHRDV